MICLWRREEFCGLCLLFGSMGSRDFSLLLIVGFVELQRAVTLQSEEENCWRLRVGLWTDVSCLLLVGGVLHSHTGIG